MFFLAFCDGIKNVHTSSYRVPKERALKNNRGVVYEKKSRKKKVDNKFNFMKWFIKFPWTWYICNYFLLTMFSNTHFKKFFYTLPNIKRLWKYCDRHQKKLSSCVRHKERIRAQKKMKIAVLLREIKLSVHRTHKSIVIEHSFFLFLVASIFL